MVNRAAMARKRFWQGVLSGEWIQARLAFRASQRRRQRAASVSTTLWTRWRAWSNARRLRPNPKSRFSVITDLWNPVPLGLLKPRDAVTLILRHASVLLIAFTALGLILDAFPIQLAAGPTWYLTQITRIAESAPVLILASCLGFISLWMNVSRPVDIFFRRRLTLFSRVLAIASLILLPAMVSLAVWYYGSSYADSRLQLSLLRSRSGDLIRGAQSQTTTQGFIQFLQSRELTADYAAIARSPLPAVKKDFVRNVKLGLIGQERKISDSLREGTLRFAFVSVKLFGSLFLFALFSVAFQRALHRLSVDQSASVSDGATKLESANEPG